MALFYIDFKTMGSYHVLTMGYYISDSIKQPISSHILTDNHLENNSFPEEAIICRRLMKNSIENGTVR